MRFNTQTILHNPREGLVGDCWRTCIACLLDMEPSEVPHFAALDGNWWANTQAWLMQRGLALYQYAYMDDFEAQGISGCHHIITGPSPRDPENVRHSVIGMDGQVFWDPHPSRAGLHNEDDRNTWYTTLLIRLNAHGAADQPEANRPHHA